MEWTRTMADGSAETTPLAYDGVLYVASTRDVIQALSAETGDLIWEYRRDLPEDVWGYTGRARPQDAQHRHLGRVHPGHERRPLPPLPSMP